MLPNPSTAKGGSDDGRQRKARAMMMHKSITEERVREAVEREMTTLDNPGFCIACGEEASECEPDARRYECEYCGERRVYGAAKLLFCFI
jgi:hypothetical protein